MRFSIDFFDFWHLSSGVSAGVKLDSLVVKDRDGIPYVPGKTIKGLLREVLEILDSEKTTDLFGKEGSNQAKIYISNASLSQDTIEYLNKNSDLKKHLFDKITSTKIGSNGIAEDDTLREIEVVVPLKLFGEIEVSKEDEEFISKGLKMIKQIGLNRNRGLGRCKFEVIK